MWFFHRVLSSPVGRSVLKKNSERRVWFTWDEIIFIEHERSSLTLSVQSTFSSSSWPHTRGLTHGKVETRGWGKVKLPRHTAIKVEEVDKKNIQRVQAAGLAVFFVCKPPFFPHDRQKKFHPFKVSNTHTATWRRVFRMKEYILSTRRVKNTPRRWEAIFIRIKFDRICGNLLGKSMEKSNWIFTAFHSHTITEHTSKNRKSHRIESVEYSRLEWRILGTRSNLGNFEI